MSKKKEHNPDAVAGKTLESIKNLREQVERCLQDFPETRDSDITLTIKIWETFFQGHVKVGSTGQRGIWFTSLYKIPREDNVKRHRAVFQNVLGLYMPSTLKIAQQRKIREEVWREAMRKDDEYKRL